MIERLSQLVDRLSTFFAHRKGLLPLIGMALVLINLLFQIIPTGWLTTSNFFLHIGVIVGIFGLMLARAL